MSKLIVLDLDETVGVFSENTTHLNQELEHFWFQDACGRSLLFYMRPYVMDFLKKSVQEFSDIAIWSAGQPYYVTTIVKGIEDLLRQRNIEIKWKFVWDHGFCDPLHEGVKDLFQMNRIFSEYQPENITYFDDEIFHIKYNLKYGFNCILVPKYRLNTTDQYFQQLHPSK